MENEELTWVKSEMSAHNGGCVELAALPSGGVAVRSSRDKRGPMLRFTALEWSCFKDGVLKGEFDRFGG